MASAPSASWNSRCITHLANCPNRSLPTNSSDESNNNGLITGTCKCAGGSFERGAKGGIKLLSLGNYVMFAAAISPQGVTVGSLEDPNSAYIGFERSDRKSTRLNSSHLGISYA